MKNRGGEIKREILLSLIIILIFLTVVGTWTVLEALDNQQISTGANVVYNYDYEGEDVGGGKVGVEILPPEENG